MGKDICDGHGPRDHAHGWLALHLSGNLSHVFLAMSAALTVFGLINAAAVAGGAWFGPIRWSVLRRAYAVVRDRT